MDKYILVNVVKELIGSTEPYGSSDVDDERFLNQEKLIEVFYECANTLVSNAEYINRTESSMKRIASSAERVLKEVCDTLQDYGYINPVVFTQEEKSMLLENIERERIILERLGEQDISNKNKLIDSIEAKISEM